ncbi:MAG: phytanoyl-CoA dioxygenase family protein, partial [Sphingobacteriaceae bacterium]|nr:phytanoyl-CoA dioxygenase family protein [Cytophagaceae bacterium]
MAASPLNPTQIRQYQHDGYLIIREFLNADEVTKLYQVAIEDSAVSKNAINVNDS